MTRKYIRSIDKTVTAYRTISVAAAGNSEWETRVKEVEPEAYLRMEGSTRQVVRPRRETDPKALVKWYPISGLHVTGEEAWKDALSQLQNLD